MEAFFGLWLTRGFHFMCAEFKAWMAGRTDGWLDGSGGGDQQHGLTNECHIYIEARSLLHSDMVPL